MRGSLWADDLPADTGCGRVDARNFRLSSALRVSDTDLSRPDAFALIPALAYDREGYRLGYGKGYYDRFLSGFGGTSAGIFYSDLLFNQLPRGFFDRKVSLLVSDRGVILPDA